MLQDPDLISIQEVRAKVDQAYAAWTRYRSVSQSASRRDRRGDGRGRAHAMRSAWPSGRSKKRATATRATSSRKTCWRRICCRNACAGCGRWAFCARFPNEKIVEIGVPMGVVAAILPTTNPTSTAIYKTLIALKAGNGIVLAPHPRARACTCETAAILADAAVKAGAPEGLVQCIANSTIEATNELMRHRRTAVILSTGGAASCARRIRAASPRYGVGPGNVPVLVDISADIPACDRENRRRKIVRLRNAVF